MKDLNIQKEIEQIKKVSLTSNEKSKMLHNLSMYADMHMPVSSPVSIYSFFKQPFVRKFSYAIATILITILTGGSLAYASEASLPGDLLYPIKTNVVEPIKMSMAKDPEERAVLESEFASKRLKEAEELDKLGKLTPEFKKNIDERFNTHFLKYREFKKEVENNIFYNERTEDIEKEFDDKMNSHNEILKKFDRDVKGMKKIERKDTTSDEDKSEAKPGTKRPVRDTERN